MQFFIAFLEGIITFISPCLLPMLPIYISYFAAGGQRGGRATLVRALGFVLGFTLLFTAMGALAGTLGALLTRYRMWVDVLCGLIVILFGLNYLGLFRINLFRGSRHSVKADGLGFWSCVTFGIVFSVGWTPCVGAFLGSALALASQQAHVLTGMLMLLAYSAGLGIPFLLSALLLDRLSGAFGWIKAHYALIDRICGSFLVLVGILMATGTLGRLLALLS